jgi:hypothetical protein
MLRAFIVVSLCFATFGGAVAGTIVPIDLTNSPVGVGTCVGFGCAPTISSTTVGTFENFLFSGVMSPSSPAPSPNAQTIGPTSFIVNAQSGAPNDDIYVSPNPANTDTSILIDLGTCTGTAPASACGIYNVDDLYTMIQGSGAFGYQGVTITLNGVASDGTTPITDVIGLTSGVDYRSTNSSIASTCTDANSNNPTNSATTACTGQISDTASVFDTDSNPGGTGGNTVLTYNNVLGSETSGSRNFYLDVQELELGTNFLGAYLDSVTITNDDPNGGKSQIVFSGLTADVATPEPGTVALLGIGLGLIGFWGIRSRSASSLSARD